MDMTDNDVISSDEMTQTDRQTNRRTMDERPEWQPMMKDGPMKDDGNPIEDGRNWTDPGRPVDDPVTRTVWRKPSQKLKPEDELTGPIEPN